MESITFRGDVIAGTTNGAEKGKIRRDVSTSGLSESGSGVTIEPTCPERKIMKTNDVGEHSASPTYSTPFASVGDVIFCSVQNPFPQTLRVVLSTPEACDYGNELIAAGRWRKE